jgi:hypothetical protein
MAGAVMLAATLMTGCSDVLDTGSPGSGGDFDVSVQVGSVPVYSWSAGPAFDVQVIRVNQPTLFAWRISDPNTRNIRSPVTHGSQPSGTFRLGNEEPSLAPGVLYRVTVELANGNEAWREFRP